MDASSFVTPTLCNYVAATRPAREAGTAERLSPCCWAEEPSENPYGRERKRLPCVHHPRRDTGAGLPLARRASPGGQGDLPPLGTWGHGGGGGRAAYGALARAERARGIHAPRSSAPRHQSPPRPLFSGRRFPLAGLSGLWAACPQTNGTRNTRASAQS